MKPIGNDWNEWKREDEVEIAEEVHWVELNTAENSNFKFAPPLAQKRFRLDKDIFLRLKKSNSRLRP